jgi:hypothetical protein
MKIALVGNSIEIGIFIPDQRIGAHNCSFKMIWQQNRFHWRIPSVTQSTRFRRKLHGEP